VGLGQAGSFFSLQETGKIRHPGFPVNLPLPVSKSHRSQLQKPFQHIFKSGQIIEVFNVAQGKSKRLQGVIEADNAKTRAGFPGGSQNRYRVGRRTQPDIPEHELSRVMPHPFWQVELLHIKRLGLSRRTDDRVKCF